MGLLAGFILFSVLFEESFQISNRDKIYCFESAQHAVENEPDKKLQKVMAEALETIADLAMDVMLELSDEQIKRFVNYYFSGTCGDLKSLFENS